MKFQELNALAAPAPWTVDEAQPSWQMHDRAQGGAYFTTVEDANARLAAHCRNNFGKALAALKRAVPNVDKVDPADAFYIRNLIAELEEVP